MAFGAAVLGAACQAGAPLLERQIVEVDVPATMLEAAQGHDPRRAAALERLQQQPGQGEVAEVVGPELELEADFTGRTCCRSSNCSAIYRYARKLSKDSQQA